MRPLARRLGLAQRLALAWLGLVACLAAGAGWLSPYNPAATAPAASLAPPSRQHWLGADLLGRDVLSRMLWGAQRTLGVALMALAITSLPGLGLGLAAGMLGPAAEGWLMRGVEVALALPQLLIALVIVSALGPGPWSVGIAVGLAGVAGFARLARSAVLQVRGQAYIQAARALGMGPVRIALRHILPNIAGPLAALLTIYLAWSILNTTTLAFLGFSGSPSIPDWGLILNEGRPYLVSAPWVSAAPGAAITLTVLAVQALGNAGGGEA